MKQEQISPELPIEGKAIAGVKLGVEKGGFGLGVVVGGGITANLDFDLIDPNNDGKVRGDELSSPQGCLAIHGGLSAALEASITVLGLSITTSPLSRRTSRDSMKSYIVRVPRSNQHPSWLG